METKETLNYLRSPEAVREQATYLLGLAKKNQLEHFSFHEEKIPDVVNYVEKVIKANYPTLEVPFHSRWRHFNAGGVDRNAELDKKLSGASPEDIARSKIELAIVSVLLDAGAGDKWSFKEEGTGKTYSRSEGLAVASFHMFVDGGFASDPDTPFMVDQIGLSNIDKKMLSAYFQTGPQNPMQGFDGRLSLLHRLGNTLQQQKTYFMAGQSIRLGGLFDYFDSVSANGKISARKVLTTILDALGPIWPGRISMQGKNLGDVWKHSKIPTDGPAIGHMPFHKLSQWLTYSIIEPIQESGLEVTSLDELTGLAEYRNGGLMIDSGLISLKNPALEKEKHKPDSELIVEWRALTVALLDIIADGIRKKLGKSSLELPLVSVLEGGTWSAGRKIAAEKRPGGNPPLTIVSDGTVF